MVPVPAWFPATITYCVPPGQDFYVPEGYYGLTWRDGYADELGALARNIRTKCYLDVCGQAPGTDYSGFNAVTHESPNRGIGRDGSTGTWEIVLVNVTKIAHAKTTVAGGIEYTLVDGAFVQTNKIPKM